MEDIKTCRFCGDMFFTETVEPIWNGYDECFCSEACRENMEVEHTNDEALRKDDEDWFDTLVDYIDR